MLLVKVWSLLLVHSIFFDDADLFLLNFFIIWLICSTKYAPCKFIPFRFYFYSSSFFSYLFLLFTFPNKLPEAVSPVLINQGGIKPSVCVFFFSVSQMQVPVSNVGFFSHFQNKLLFVFTSSILPQCLFSYQYHKFYIW